MKLGTYHTHTTMCDGKNTAEEMVQEAIKLGLSEIGFSGHAPMEIPCSWELKDTKEYVKTILELKEKYKSKIKIYLGIEQDYYSKPYDYDYDYVIGSVHYVYKNGDYLPVDTSVQAFKEFIHTHYNDDVYGYCEDYYKLVADVYRKTKCNIIGHFDLVTKFNEKLPMIDTSNERYVKAVNDALDVLLKAPAIFEVNTGAISRGYRTKPYPEEFILDKIAKSEKKLVINSDTHSVDSIQCKYSDVVDELDKKGYYYIKGLEEIL